ncbi:MAG: Alcohol dehydrogenase zinc-binding domain protein, partial [Myxococcaceae bacterium]|nr:Alcohol dehydrogenase zinc-binding domain protein [Myxococcaceae bacterium]
LDLGRLLGLRVFGTASPGKHDFVRSLHGTPFDYRQGDFVGTARAAVPEGFSVVMDGIGGRNLCQSHALVRDGGTLVAFGFQSATSNSRGAALPTLARTGWLALSPRCRTRFYAIMPFNRLRLAWIRSDMEFVLERLGRGELAPVIADVLPLAEIARAQRLLEQGEVRGKLVLRVSTAARAASL